MDDDGHGPAALGWGGRWPAVLGSMAAGAVPARVVRVDGPTALVATGAGVDPERVHFPGLAVGDWVAQRSDGVELLPRAGTLRREDPDGGEQVLAANVDIVALVAGLDRPVRPGRLHRGVTQAWDAGAVPLVVLTKADVVDDPADAVRSAEQELLGVEVVAVSVRHGDGLEDVRARLTDRTAVLLGESGAGKSTLLNALLGEEVAATGRVRHGDAKGRHTTTRRELHVVPTGGVIIDTPGVRALGVRATAEAVDDAFADVVELAAGCRFSDCRHDGEPGCAVLDAITSGDLASGRLEAYRELADEAGARMPEHERRRADRRFARAVQEGIRFKRSD